MNFHQARPLILKYIIDTENLYGRNLNERDLTFIGQGVSAIIKIEKEIQRKLPDEFRFYLENLAFSKNQHFVDFYQGFDLYGYSELGADKSSPWGDFVECQGVIFFPLVIASDTSIAFVADVGHPSCPVYRVDEMYDWKPKLMASSLADFLLILFCREYVFKKDFLRLEQNGWKDKPEEFVEDYEMLRQLIMQLSPNSSRVWDIHE